MKKIFTMSSALILTVALNAQQLAKMPKAELVKTDIPSVVYTGELSAEGYAADAVPFKAPAATERDTTLEGQYFIDGQMYMSNKPGYISGNVFLMTPFKDTTIYKSVYGPGDWVYINQNDETVREENLAILNYPSPSYSWSYNNPTLSVYDCKIDSGNVVYNATFTDYMYGYAAEAYWPGQIAPTNMMNGYWEPQQMTNCEMMNADRSGDQQNVGNRYMVSSGAAGTSWCFGSGMTISSWGAGTLDTLVNIIPIPEGASMWCDTVFVHCYNRDATDIAQIFPATTNLTLTIYPIEIEVDPSSGEKVQRFRHDSIMAQATATQKECVEDGGGYSIQFVFKEKNVFGNLDIKPATFGQYCYAELTGFNESKCNFGIYSDYWPTPTGGRTLWKKDGKFHTYGDMNIDMAFNAYYTDLHYFEDTRIDEVPTEGGTLQMSYKDDKGQWITKDTLEFACNISTDFEAEADLYDAEGNAINPKKSDLIADYEIITGPYIYEEGGNENISLTATVTIEIKPNLTGKYREETIYLKAYGAKLPIVIKQPSFLNVTCFAENGIVEGAGSYHKGDYCTLFAKPNYGYHFTQWSDGNTDNPRTIQVLNDTTFTAKFAKNIYTISVEAEHGSITGGGDYEYLSSVQLTATADEHYHFVRWSDEVTDNPRQITIEGNKTYTAIFSIDQFTISTYAGNGVVEGAGIYDYGTKATLTVIPNFGYEFANWSDGNTDNPRIVSVTEDATYNSTCTLVTKGICGDNLYWEFGKDSLIITGSGNMYDFNIDNVPWLRLEHQITTISLPIQITSIGSNAFNGCEYLSKIEIPNAVNTIDDSAFSGCTTLTSITIPNSITTIGENAFAGCNNITSVIWNAKNCNSWNFGSQVESFTFGNEVETIPNELCKEMSKLTSIIIPNSVTTIGESAFENCTHLVYVTLGSSLSNIGCNAFKGDFRMEEITIFAEYTPDVCSTTFDGVSKPYVYLYVPEKSIRKYQVDPNWNVFDIRTKAAEVTPIDSDEPIVEPTDQDVTIIWPITDGTATYTLTITKGGEMVCVLTFNADGRLTNIAFAAPGHNGPRQAPAATLTAQGYQFTVTGLNPGTAYDYSVTATDARGKMLAEHQGNFSTKGGEAPTSVDKVHDVQPTPKGLMHKVLRNGQILLERNNATYTLMGQKVK